MYNSILILSSIQLKELRAYPYFFKLKNILTQPISKILRNFTQNFPSFNTRI